MKVVYKIFSLALALLIIGCATQQKTQEIRYYRSYNKSPEFTSYLQGKHYKLWYDEEFYAQFIKIEKGSDEWKATQKQMPVFILDYLFINSENGLCLMIYRNRYRRPYNEILKMPGFKIIESDQRLVNNTPTLYIRGSEEKDDWIMVSMYCINYKSGVLAVAFAYPPGSWEEHKEGIMKALNGIELD